MALQLGSCITIYLSVWSPFLRALLSAALLYFLRLAWGEVYIYLTYNFIICIDNIDPTLTLFDLSLKARVQKGPIVNSTSLYVMKGELLHFKFKVNICELTEDKVQNQFVLNNQE